MFLDFYFDLSLDTLYIYRKSIAVFQLWTDFSK